MAAVNAVALLALPLASARAADVTITTDQTAGVSLDSASGSTVEVQAGVTVSNPNISPSGGITATTQGWSVTNNGAVTTSYGPAIGLTSTGGGTVINAAGATITSTGSGPAVTISKSSNGGVGTGTVDNSGTITGGSSSDTVSLYGGGSVTNRAGGTITGSATNTVSMSGGTSRTVTNSGTISNTGTGTYATGVLVQGGASTVTNLAGGSITAKFNGVYASSTSPLTLQNDGTITATGTSGSTYAVEADGGGTITNTGTIQSPANGILMKGNAAGAIINTGTIGTTASGNAIVFSGNSAHTLTLGTGSVLNGNVVGSTSGSAVDKLVLQGTGTQSLTGFSNFEQFVMDGSSWTVSGTGSFSGAASVDGGTLTIGSGASLAAGSMAITDGGILIVNGSETGTLTIGAGGRLGGTGTVGATVVQSGGVIAPGNSIGTLNVAGGISFASGATYAVEVNAAGGGDRIAATGAATISGGTVSVLAASGAYAPSTSYTILTADGGVSGIFASVLTNLAFLNPSLLYTDPNSVVLVLERNAVDFVSVADTANQKAVATAITGLATDSPVYLAVAGLDEAGARAAFDHLSGEMHASLMSVFLDDSKFVRDAALGRLRTAVPGATPVGSVPSARLPGTDVSVWAQGYGAWGRIGADDGHAGLDRTTGGLLVGADATADNGWRVGVVAGFGSTSVDIDALGSSADAEVAHVGVYAGTAWDVLSLRLGGAATWYDTSTSRLTGETGVATDHLHTAVVQGFAELARTIELDPVSVEPYGRLALVGVSRGAVDETGSAADLRGDATSAAALFGTLGIRLAVDSVIAERPIRVSGGLAWQHAAGDLTPAATLAFDGSDPFRVTGAALDRDAALVEAGVEIGLGPMARLGASYQGQFGARLTDNQVKARLSVRF